MGARHDPCRVLNLGEAHCALPKGVPVARPPDAHPPRPRRRSRYHRSVKRGLAWFAGLVGIAALGRWLSRRRHPAESIAKPPEAAADDPAEELRRKLADARRPEPEVEPVPVEETLEERRARVHAKAREAIDAMGDDGSAA